MLEVGEYYTYVSEGSEFDVEYLGEGMETFWVNHNATPFLRHQVQIYRGTKNGNIITVEVGKKSKKIIGGKYKSSGSVIPIKYIGEGYVDLKPIMGMTIPDKKGSVFTMYDKPLVLDDKALQDKVHPTEVVMNHLEGFTAIKSGSLTGRFSGGPPAPMPPIGSMPEAVELDPDF